VNKEACFSHNTDNWKTPSVLYNAIVKDCHYIDLFPYCSMLDQYENKDYHGKKLFINPPYSHLNTKKFKEYITLLISQGNKIYLLIPSRTDTKIFQYLSVYCEAIIFFKGRLHFNDSKEPAPFPSCLMRLTNFRLFPTYVRFCSVEEFCGYEKQ